VSGYGSGTSNLTVCFFMVKCLMLSNVTHKEMFITMALYKN